MRAAADGDADAMSALADRYRSIRGRSLALIAGLSAEDCAAQAMPDASPQKWHLAHTSWFFETFVLDARAGDNGLTQACRHLFNSYYQSVGAPYPRARRGLLTRPALDEVLSWRARVDAAMLDAISAGRVDAGWVELGLQHEQQHQELMRTDLLALMAISPLRPCVPAEPEPAAHPLSDEAAGRQAWLQVSGGIVRIGHSGCGFCFDNELPAHDAMVAPFAMARHLVTQRDYLRFMDEGGYRDSAWWLSDGWDWVKATGRICPQYWRHDDRRGWVEYGLHGERCVRLDAGSNSDAAARPVACLSYYEADAYARWAGARLPTEQEWEAAVREHGDRLAQLFGECWQWTASAYAAYPGYRPAAGAAGEYNGKFMVNQQVLRGSSAYTPPGHARTSYRNFFPPSATWQRSGLRLAR